MAKASGATITIPGELDIKAAAPLAAGLIAARGADLVLNASQVERVGAQCMQVLLSAAATWSADGVELALEEPSQAFIDAAAIAGLDLSRFATTLTARNS